jgi:2-beta-glucuronyltransferase
MVSSRVLSRMNAVPDRTCVAPRTRQGNVPNILIISGHDYRTPSRASMHFIAAELARRAHVRFFSIGYSRLSRLKNDPRASLAARANRSEVYRDIECYLWKTALHPFNMRKPSLRAAERLMFWAYERWPNPVLKEWVRDADVVLFESGLSPLFFESVAKLNPKARKIYVASDDLSTIGVSPCVQTAFTRVAHRFDVVSLPSRSLARDMPPSAKVFYIQRGIDSGIADHADPSPYGPGRHAVSIGSMLFDPTFFEIAASHFENVTFHVIGSGRDRLERCGSNVVMYDYMSYTRTLPYIKHADFGVAPYASASLPAYLADTSNKLVHFDFFGTPAVCPVSVVGERPSRFGYVPGDKPSIVAAINRALSAGRSSARTSLSWSDTVDRMLHPDEFADTQVNVEVA